MVRKRVSTSGECAPRHHVGKRVHSAPERSASPKRIRGAFTNAFADPGGIAALISGRAPPESRPLNVEQRMALAACKAEAAVRERGERARQRNKNVPPPPTIAADGSAAHPQWFCTFGSLYRPVKPKAYESPRRIPRSRTPPTPPPRHPPPPDELFIGHIVRAPPEPAPVHREKEVDWMGRVVSDPPRFRTVSAGAFLAPPAAAAPGFAKKPPPKLGCVNAKDAFAANVPGQGAPPPRECDRRPHLRAPSPAPEATGVGAKLAPQPRKRRPPACPQAEPLPDDDGPPADAAAPAPAPATQPGEESFRPTRPASRPPSSAPSGDLSDSTSAIVRQAQGQFPVGSIVRDLDRQMLGMVVNHNRGRVGVKLAGARDPVGQVPGELEMVERAASGVPPPQLEPPAAGPAAVAFAPRRPRETADTPEAQRERRPSGPAAARRPSTPGPGAPPPGRAHGAGGGRAAAAALRRPSAASRRPSSAGGGASFLDKKQDPPAGPTAAQRNRDLARGLKVAAFG
eukprot:TRINITY_DN3412_c0_g1_i1.p1 TRINITY_DN3412_c0_g1~~TRINITY_DN3412_c0_g1_i1.p1  ORF type:complete len:539 (+),score=107.08 TRINITY_DN3412_c0_g1_i1:81-1619(+)